MENIEHQITTENLQQRLIKRIAQVVSGCILVILLGVVVPAISLAPAPLSPLLDSSHGTVPASALLAHHSLAWIPVVLALILLGPILFGIYDTVRIYLALRDSREDDQLFP